MAACPETQKIPSLLSPGQGKSADKDVFTITVTFVQHKNVPKTDEDGGDHTSVKSTKMIVGEQIGGEQISLIGGEQIYLPVGQAVTRSSLKREVRSSNLGPVKSDTVLPTARHR